MNIKDILSRYQNRLTHFSSELNEVLSYDPRSFAQAVKSCTLEENYYHYTSPVIRVTLSPELIPNHTIPHFIKGAESSIDITLKIDDEIIFNALDEGVIKDPLSQLSSFNILISSDIYSSSWHLDRHDEVLDVGSSYDYIHPIYHWTFGGYHMEEEHARDENFYGNAIVMRTPRIMHPPMELMLGLDFILNQFVHSGYLDIINDPSYNAIIHELKSYLWRPFFLAQARNYCKSIVVDGKNQYFDDRFVKSTIRSY